MIQTKTKEGYDIQLPNIFKGYKIIKTLGNGGTSAVFQVQKQRTGKFYSAKVIPKKYIKENNMTNQIKTEIRIMKKIDHPNIVKFHESFEYKNIRQEIYIIIISEYCENGDLFTYCANERFDNENQKKSVFIGLLNAIKYLHDQKIAHGDIKLDNILLDSNLNAKLTDFGYCKTQEKMGDDSKSGTLYYAAPEMFIRGEFDTLKSDIWSIGICLYCLYQNCFPFRNGNYKSIVNQITSHKLSLGFTIEKDLRDIVERCTEKDAENRPTINDLINDEFFNLDKNNFDEYSEPSSTENESKSENFDNYCSIFI